MRAEDMSHFKITSMPREEKNKNHFHKTQKRLVVPFVCDSQRGSHLYILLSFLSLLRSLCGCLFPSLPRNGHNLHMCSLTFRHNKIIKSEKPRTIKTPEYCTKISLAPTRCPDGMDWRPHLTNLLDIHHPQNCPIERNLYFKWHSQSTSGIFINRENNDSITANNYHHSEQTEQVTRAYCLRLFWIYEIHIYKVRTASFMWRD